MPEILEAARRNSEAANVIMQCRPNSGNDVTPLARFILPKQTGGRVPWAVFAIAQPAPTGVVTIN